MDRHHLNSIFVVLLLALVLPSCTVSYLIEDDEKDKTGASELGDPSASQLHEGLASLVENFEGTAGIYYKDLETGEEFGINEKQYFPTASLVKVPILVNVFDAIDKGEFGYEDRWAYNDSLFYAGDDDLLNSFKNGEKVSVSKLVLLMITISDNTASLWLQGRLGGTRINKWLEENGFEATRVNSRTEGRQADFEKYGWGQTSPKEMAKLFEQIRNGELISESASEEMYRALTRIHWNDEALSQIPPYVQAASKQGAVNQSRSEVVLVNAPTGDYLFSVITKDQKDQSWDASNEGFVLIREVSKLLWNHFEPGSKWTSTAD